MRTPPRHLAALLLAAALAPAARAAPGEQAVTKGSVIGVDLSQLPTRLELRGTAICAGSRVTATGDAEEVPCQRPFTFEAPVKGEPVVVLFRPKAGGAPLRRAFPFAWDPRPQRFTAPADGVVGLEDPPPPPKGEEGPRKLPPELLGRARAAAAEACGGCGGAGSFALKDLTVEALRAPPRPVVLTIQAPPTAPQAP